MRTPTKPNPPNDGSKVGLFLRVPDQIAAKRRALSDDKTPPHITFLILGDLRNAGGLDKLLEVLRGCIARYPAKCWAVLGDIRVSTNTEGQKIVWQSVRFEDGSFDSGPCYSKLHQLRENIVEWARNLSGFQLKDHSPNHWTPHFTRAYLPYGAEVAIPEPIHGAWDVWQLEIWGYGEPISLSLTTGNLTRAVSSAEPIVKSAGAPGAVLHRDPLAGLRQAMAELVSGNAARWRAFWRGDVAEPAGLGTQEEQELPDWLGELLEGAVEASNGLLIKGAGHKYIRRVPKAGGGWRYFYTVTGGHGLGHHAEMVTGAAFKIRSRDGQEGHVHILEDHGDEVTLRHDESGKSARVSKKALASMLHAEHAEALGKVRERASKTLEQAQKTGTAKQQSRAATLVEKYSGAGKALAKPSPKWTPADAPGRYGVVTPAVLEQVNALPLPTADTRVGQTWRERRHHLGDVSIAASGAYAVLHDQAHAQLERAWRAKRLEDAGFNPYSAWGQIKADTARSGGASETVPVGTKPAPFVPPSQVHAGADVQGGTPSGLDRAQSAATRSKPRSRMDLQRPIVGPSGAKLTAYEWQHKFVDDVDKRGEDRVRRISDWDKAAPSEHTGRDIVHHFEVVTPGGEAKTVSAESALDLLGYTNKSERAKVRGLAEDMIEHAQASARLDELESANQRFDAAHAAVSADPSTPRAFRPARFEGMWAHHDIGGKSYKTHATIWGTMDDSAKRERMASLHRSFVNELAAERAGLNAVETRRLESELRPTRERVATLRQRLNDKAAAVSASNALGQGSIFKSLVAKYARLVV